MIVNDYIEEFLLEGILEGHSKYTIDEDTPELPSKTMDHLVKVINSSLTEVYTRFDIREDELIVNLSESRKMYELIPANAVSHNPDGYIDDSLHPYNDVMGKIISITDENYNPINFNDDTDMYGVYSMGNTTLHIPTAVDNASLYVRYRAKHPKVVLESDLEIPEALLPLLTAYIGYRIYSGTSKPEEIQKASSFYAEYELLCSRKAHTLDGVNTPDLSFDVGGYV